MKTIGEVTRNGGLFLFLPLFFAKKCDKMPISANN